MTKISLTTAVVATTIGSLSADVTVDTIAPESPIAVTSTPNGGTLSRIFDYDAPQTNHARGNGFFLSEAADSYVIESVTIESATAQSFDADTMTLYIYQGTTGQFGTGTGYVDGDPSYYEGTSVTPLTEESFTVTGDLVAGEFLTFTLTTPITVDPGERYGFFFTYEQINSSLTSFAYYEGGAVDDIADGRTLISETAHVTASSRQMNYWIGGQAIDEGILNPVMTASSNMIVAGENLTLSISFDPTADTATLDTPTGTIDLFGIDAADETPGDGMVTITETPTATFTYTANFTKAGETAVSTSVDVEVEQPVTEAPDNAFSLAVKADTPYYYYRFEEEAGATSLLDSSGNDFHTSDIVGNITFGDNVGGIGNAALFPASAASFLTEATSEMSEDFTVMAVMNVSDMNSNSLYNIFTMPNGTGVGRSLFFYGQGGFHTFISGSQITLSGGNTIPEDITCLVHAVFDMDADGDSETEDPEVRFYINGVLQATTSIGAVAANEAAWLIGSNKNRGSQTYDGYLDEVAMFTSTLTDEEIAAHGDAFFSAADAYLGFTADVESLPLGESVTLTWKTSDAATGVTINGQPVDGATEGGLYTATYTPGETTSYVLEVTGPDGTETATVDVVVTAPAAAPVITNITVTESDVIIEATGTPNATYFIRFAVPSSFPENFDQDIRAGEITMDIDGTGTATFSKIEPSEFYRLELQE
ncbi:MAG: LamG-like jellyroll fold domain-containing protein [Verrucomicrobiota bacterium JB023]|nr:LamG-like jellyroll fold domain-containing protein [Verrucomicrobiota bacterium JB023]